MSPRFNRANTPLAKRRAPRGSRMEECRFPHTIVSLQHLEGLRVTLNVSQSETGRIAFAVASVAVESPELVKRIVAGLTAQLATAQSAGDTVTAGILAEQIGTLSRLM